MRIKDLPTIERPREKLERYGPGKLSIAELVAVILGTGSHGMNAVELARKLTLKFPKGSLAGTSLSELRATFGLGLGKACQLIACFELGRRYFANQSQAPLISPVDIWRAVSDIASRKKEHFIVFYLDSRRQEIDREVISVGTISASLVHPREVFEPAVRNLASSVIVVHNHPSGNLEPSAEDLAVTDRLVDAGKILGVPLLDHIIVSRHGHLSLKEKGHL